MIHLGDITKIHGYDAPTVDCIIGGSPCQDLSIAGKRAGLQGERSGLFMEQIRIVKEMRERDKSTGRTGQYVRPRYMVWENVPGAFSSHKGNDFAAVLEETIHIIEPEAPPIPVPKKGWPTSGCLMGAEWSFAWRVFDAQFWGVPQRRKRIALVADFGGESAPEILFERKSLSWNPNKSRPEGKAIAESAQNRSAGNDRMVEHATPINTQIATRYKALGERTGLGIGKENDPAYTLQAGHEHGVCYCIAGNVIDRSETAGANGTGALVQTEKVGMLSTLQDQTLFQLIQEPTYCISGNTVDRATNQNGTGVRENSSFTLNTVDRHAVVYKVPVLNDQCGGKMDVSYDVVGTLRANAKGHDQIVLDALPFDTTQLTSPQNGSNPHWGDPCHPLAASAHTPSVVVKAFDERGNGDGQIAPTITGDHENRTTDYTAIAIERKTFNEQSFSCYKESEKCSTLKAKSGNIGNGSECLIAEKTSVAVDAYNGAVTGDKTASLTCKNDGSHSGPLVAKKIIRCIVRRLTPVECERLQGFPDGWTSIGEWVDSKGRKHELKDSPRYKALGNSIAIPSWKWVLKRLCAQYERDATMASLFDGIGGFPLIWEQLNGKGSCLWASEIEEFPIAVTKIHFPEKAGENNGQKDS